MLDSSLNPLVSVNIITFNRGEYLINALKSVLNQKYKKLEIIIIDDGSTDNTEALLSNYINIITYVKFPKSGKTICREYARKISKGNFIALLDSDDIWNENYISESINIMNLYKLDILLNKCEIHLFKNGNKKISILNYSSLRKKILYSCPAPTSGMVIRNTNFEGFHWCLKHNINEDWHLQIRLIISNKGLKVGFNANINWTKFEDNKTTLKRNSIDYKIDRVNSYAFLYNTIKKDLSLVERLIYKLRFFIYKIHIYKHKINEYTS